MSANTDHVRDVLQRLSTGSKVDSNNLKQAVEKISDGSGIKTEDYPEFDSVCQITKEISDHAVEIYQEIFENAIETWGFNKSDIENALIELQEYRKLGTIEEVKKAVEKTKAKKMKSKNSIKRCPLCGAIAQKDFGLFCAVEYFYCVNCGQRLEG